MLNNFLKYLSGDIVAKALGLLSIPVYTRFISPQEFGTYTIILSYAAIASFLFSLNAHTSISRFMYEKNVDYKGFISTTLILSAVIFFISSSLLLILNDSFVDKLLGFEFSIYKNYFILFVSLAIIFSIYIQILIPQLKSKEYSILIVTQAYSKFIVVLIFFYFIEATALRYLQAVLLVDLIIILYIFWNLKQYFKPKLNKIHVKYILNYSILLIPYMLSAVILAQIDRVMIGSMIGEYEAGIYSVGYAFGSAPLVIFAAFSHAWMPKYFSNMNEGEYSSLDKDVLVVVLATALGISIYSTYIGYLLSFLLSDSYQLSLQHIPLISMAMFFAIMWNIWGRGITFAKKTIWTSIAGIISAMANIYLNSILIPNFGLDGAVYATYLSYILMAALGYIFAKYVLKIHTTSVLELKNIILGIFLISLYFYYMERSSIISLQVTFPIVLLILYYVRRGYINDLVKRLKKI